MGANHTKLDTRAARCDLTSRECCKLMCAALAGARLPLPVLRTLFTVLHAASARDPGPEQTQIIEQGFRTLSGLGVEDAMRLSCVSTMLGACFAGVGEQAAPGAFEAALNWINEQGDEFWGKLGQQAHEPTTVS